MKSGLFRHSARAVGLLAALGLATGAMALEPFQVTSASLAHVRKGGEGRGPNINDRNFGLVGIDSLANFTGRFRAAGFDSLDNPQSLWDYAMIGNPPDRGGTTTIRAPIIPVSVRLLDASGHQRYVAGKRMYSDARQFVNLVLNSPVFAKARYTSSPQPTQYNDAIQRATFWSQMEDNWHTVLAPKVMTPRVINLPYGSYYFATNADGTCCAFILADDNAFSSALFPPTYPVTNATVIGAAELAGEMTTRDLTTLLLPNTYLYQGGDPNNCCVLGYHSIDMEPGTAANGGLTRAYVMNYSSWISPGLFGGGFSDITAFSHEMGEAFNDPFVGFDGIHNATPWWLDPSAQICQNNLETGDVLEALPNPTYAVTLSGYTYHPQSEALLQWFEFRQHSDAIHGAYSYPDESLLTHLSPVEHAFCL